MKKKSLSRKVVLASAVLSLILFAAWASASNMGFKLNFGVVNAVNQLLYGSGVSVDTVVDDNVPAKTHLVVILDPLNQQFAKNSNMGFKLCIVSLPDGGLEVETPASSSVT